jgi:hypothetical protein
MSGVGALAYSRRYSKMTCILADFNVTISSLVCIRASCNQLCFYSVHTQSYVIACISVSSSVVKEWRWAKKDEGLVVQWSISYMYRGVVNVRLRWNQLLMWLCG